MLEWFTPRNETWLHRVHPALKFLLLFAMMLILFFNRQLWLNVVMACCYGGLLIVSSGYPVRKLLLLSLPFFLSFLSSALTLALFGRGETVLWRWGLVKISEESIHAGLVLGSKSLAIGMISLVLLLTTRTVPLFYALMQQFRFPPKYAYPFLAAMRLVPTVVEEVQIRTHALKVRGVVFSRGWKGVFQRLKLYGVPLFAQSIRRAQRIAVAMEAKQFRMNQKRTYYYKTDFSKTDVRFLVYFAGTWLLALFFGAGFNL